MDVEEIRKEIEDAGRRHYAAAMSGDARALDELLGEELVYSHSNGQTDQDKAAYLGHFVANEAYRPMEMEVVHSVERIVLLKDDVAMVRGKQITNTNGENGIRFDNQEACTLDVWAKRDGRWQLVAHHCTLVRSPDSWRKAIEAVYGS